jgi:dynein heavy chain
MMGALIVLDVHNEKIITDMITARVESINSFDWTSQLRYYWEEMTE